MAVSSRNGADFVLTKDMRNFLEKMTQSATMSSKNFDSVLLHAMTQKAARAFICRGKTGAKINSEVKLHHWRSSEKSQIG